MLWTLCGRAEPCAGELGCPICESEAVPVSDGFCAEEVVGCGLPGRVIGDGVVVAMVPA